MKYRPREYPKAISGIHAKSYAKKTENTSRAEPTKFKNNFQ